MIKIALILFVTCLIAGCSFQVGIEYTGKSAKNDNHFTPDKKPVGNPNKY